MSAVSSNNLPAQDGAVGVRPAFPISQHGASPGQQNSRPRLIVNADDFGLSASVNAAVERAHREGILTSASLMVNEPGFDGAVEVARQNPRLGVGLHLTLALGHSTLPPAAIPGLVNSRAEFSNRPVWAGLNYFFNRRLIPQLRAEIRAQFNRFRSTGLVLDHVNGHLHLHLHPAIFQLLIENADGLDIRRMRLTRDCLARSRKMTNGRWLYRVSHAAIFAWLSGRAREPLRRRRISHAQITFGLLQHARVDESFVLNLLPNLPDGASELFSHPSLGGSMPMHEMEALTSPRVIQTVRNLGVQLIRYQDL